MKSARSAYLVYVMLLACAHMIVTLSLWNTPTLVSGDSSIKLVCFIALFGAWILAGVTDLALGAMGALPLTFAGEAAFANACLAIMAVLSGGYVYVICAMVPAVLVLIKGFEETIHGYHQIQRV